jgi:hypothetical protein
LLFVKPSVVQGIRRKRLRHAQRAARFRERLIGGPAVVGGNP